METIFLHHWIVSFLGIHAKYAWAFYGAIIFLIAFFVYLFQHKVLKYILERDRKTTHVWDDTLIQALSLPLSIFIWLYAIIIFVDDVLQSLTNTDWLTTMPLTRKGISVLLLIWFFWRYMKKIENRLLLSTQPKLQKSSFAIDATTLSVVGRMVRIFLIGIGMLTLLDAFGIPLTGLLAFGGGSAIIMGIAAQQLLANWFGGFIIFLDKPFELGDWIRSPDRTIEGVVTQIGWRITEVMSFDHQPLYIPNALFNQIIIVNPQRMTHRKIDVTLGIRYEDFSVLEKIIKAMRIMIASHDKVAHNEIQWVHLVNYGTSSLDINITCYIFPTSTWRDTQQDILVKLLDIIIAHKAQLAFPTVTTYIPDSISVQSNKINAGEKYYA